MCSVEHGSHAVKKAVDQPVSAATTNGGQVDLGGVLDEREVDTLAFFCCTLLSRAFGNQCDSETAGDHRELTGDRSRSVPRVWGEASGAAARDDLIVVVRGDSAGYPDPGKLRRRCQAGDRLVELGGPPGRHGQQEALGAERQADTIGWDRELANEGHVQLAPTKAWTAMWLSISSRRTSTPG
jgi:hypothetical protein